MSSNTSLMDLTEDNIQEKTMAKNKVTSENKSGSDSTVTEKTEKKNKKYLKHHWINQGQEHKLKQNGQRNKTVKKYPYNYPVQMIKIARTGSKRHENKNT